MAAPVKKPQGCTNFKLRQLSRAVTRHYDAHLASSGLKITQYSLLSHVVLLDPIRPSDLARHMGLDTSSLTRNLQPLLAQSWARLGPGEDARSRLVFFGRVGVFPLERAFQRLQIRSEYHLYGKDPELYPQIFRQLPGVLDAFS